MSHTVLIVDDSATMRQMVGDTLRKAGYTVVEGINGEDAIRRVSGKAVSLVITDVNMPRMDGLALVRRLRADTAFRFTPILFLTTECSDQIKQEGRAAGATGWIVKPFDPGRLLQVVSRLVP